MTPGSGLKGIQFFIGVSGECGVPGVNRLHLF